MGGNSSGRTIVLNDELIDALHHLAGDMELQTSAFTRAMIAGVLDRGLAVSLAMHAFDKGLVEQPKRRRARKTLPWESDGENWHFDDWTLVRRGDRAHTERTKQPGEGWFLHGPGYEEPLDLATMSAKTAKDKANDLLLPVIEARSS